MRLRALARALATRTASTAISPDELAAFLTAATQVVAQHPEYVGALTPEIQAELTHFVRTSLATLPCAETTH